MFLTPLYFPHKTDFVLLISLLCCKHVFPSTNYELYTFGFGPINLKKPPIEPNNFYTHFHEPKIIEECERNSNIYFLTVHTFLYRTCQNSGIVSLTP
jgi:hypothetical protein